MATSSLTDGLVSPPQKRSKAGRLAGGPRPSLLDVERMAEWLGVEVVFVRRLVAERRIPFVKIGKFVRFDPADVRSYVLSSKVAPFTSPLHDS
jgi:excisionase family DNA binding protein